MHTLEVGQQAVGAVVRVVGTGGQHLVGAGELAGQRLLAQSAVAGFRGREPAVGRRP
ncbi:hypothetical protein AB0D38_05470 [Streptomyces sp. NPDC048279]|uniref:hypothetical protein n=1 Tax=Streptomyces sp. NPDC048279 TaxID=3154714 RepID=UPI00342A900A